MKLITKELEQTIPLLYTTEDVPLNKKMVYVKLFTPDSNWTWYITEYDPLERICFGYVIGFESEWGYFSLYELETVRGLGLAVERDLYFKPITFKELMKQFL